MLLPTSLSKSSLQKMSTPFSQLRRLKALRPAGSRPRLLARISVMAYCLKEAMLDLSEIDRRLDACSLPLLELTIGGVRQNGTSAVKFSVG